MGKKYAKAYTEVLEILKHIPKDEYDRIPKTEIQFYESNCDKTYKFEYDDSLAVEKQKISREANIVIVALYMNYFASSRQKSIINEILKQNTIKEEQEKNEKYDINKIFENSKYAKKNVSNENKTQISENLPVEVNSKKENFIKRIINKIKSFFQSKNAA
ncbi:MAG: hypothetical protein J6J36_05660 [Clostridia bacterium]|nr:hypothetical protein [Clostridia bacterium]